MVIDVLVNSCARPDLLEVSINTFKDRIKSDHEFRWVIAEDRADDLRRRDKGIEWIMARADMFAHILFFDKKAGPGFWFAPTIRMCKSDYFFHLEDDNEFVVDVDIDPIIELMKQHNNVVEIMLSRGQVGNVHNPRKVIIHGVSLIERDSFSVATGIFNTKLINDLLSNIGWDEQMHEAGVLTPVSKKLGMRKFTLDHGRQHYVHVGAKKGYRKGGWKK
jgi:hypothetical protein